MSHLDLTDPRAASIIRHEGDRQQQTINLIASENYCHRAVREAVGSVLTNKYAEGYPGRRYYAGCMYIDEAEALAIERAKKLFNMPYVNVQPHAGAQANMAVYAALLTPGDTLLGMSLADGGHLTHGYSKNFSGQLYNAVSYGVDPVTGLLQYDVIAELAEKYRPKLIIAGASAYSRYIDFKKFADIAQSVGAYLMVDMAHIAGLVATGIHPSPAGYADVITTTTHKTLRGPRGGMILSSQELSTRLNQAIMPGLQGGPLMNAIIGKAVAFHLALQEDFVHYQQKVVVLAQSMAHIAMKNGLRVISDGTDNHLFIVDLTALDITGLRAQQILEGIGITVNRNAIPNDPRTAWLTSGIRIGTPSLATRNFSVEHAQQLMNLIVTALKNHDDAVLLHQLAITIQELCMQFPIPYEFC